jgi:hypothetical protein
MRKSCRDVHPDEHFNDYYDEEEEFYDDSVAAEFVETGPAFAPVWTGLLDAEGEPILRHPITVRVGFHPEHRRYHTPTLETDDIPTSEAVVGWVYEA